MAEDKILICGFLHKDGKMLTAKRAMTKKHFPGAYDIPGGHLEAGEDHITCLKREFKEEFGINIIVGDLINKFNFSDLGHKITEYVYFATMENPSQPLILDKSENSEYIWTSKDEIDKYFIDSMEKESVKKGFKLINQNHAL